jgi:DNA excision repair protein ERCC-3
MAPAFYAEYLRVDREKDRDYSHVLKALAVMNPVKAWTMDFLLRVHRERKDKVIVFSDSIIALKLYTKLYGALLLCGDTKEKDKEAIIQAFRIPGPEVLFLSRVGDVALDVPDANVIIQLSAHFGSRLQEAQRMGRILRRSSDAGVSKQSFFYSLTSQDTLEEYYAAKRRRYLADQGYAYKLVPVPEGLKIASIEELRRQAAATPSEARQLATDDGMHLVLREVLSKEQLGAERAEDAAMREFRAEGGEDEGGYEGGGGAAGGGGGGGSSSSADAAAAAAAAAVFSSRTMPSLAALSGGTGLRFLEYSGDSASRMANTALEAERVERANAQRADARAKEGSGGGGGGGGGGGAGAPKKKTRHETGTL